MELETAPLCAARKCNVEEIGNGRHTITGPAQGIMFLIGRIAGFGEDGLVSVQQA